MTRSTPLLLCLALSAFVASGCASAPTTDEETDVVEGALTTYGDLFETLDDADLDRWVAVRRSLRAGFDRICGDTICSGDFSNLATVRLSCSSTAIMRKLKDCTWVLGGSIDYVDGVTGAITTDARAFTCKIPVGGTAKRMLATLEAAGPNALMTPLPATGRSFYDGLVDCFTGVMGDPPPHGPDAPTYVELGDWSWEHGDGVQWSDTKRALADTFDDACGDTFCEGEYPDLTALRFVCAVEQATARVAGCSWSFAAADSSVGPKGAIAATTTTKRCDVPVDAPAADVAAALAGDAPLYATLPGQTTSIFDALIECL